MPYKSNSKKVKQLNSFLSHLMYETGVSKEKVKDIFVAWFRLALISLRKDEVAYIPFVGSLRRAFSFKTVKVAGVGKRQKCYYLRFAPTKELKESLSFKDTKYIDGLIEKIEDYYLNHMNH